MEKQPLFGLGNPNDAFAQYFIGKSYLNQLSDPTKTALGVFNVTFEPGCRNNWHIHHAKKDSWFSHITIEVPGEETSNE